MFESVTEAEWIYFAGFFDGEGCILIYKQKTYKPPHKTSRSQMRLTISNTNHEVMEWIANRFAGYLWRAPSKQRKAVSWKWAVNSKTAACILRNIYPYLRVKRDEAEVGLEFQREVDDYKKKGHIKGLSGQRAIPMEKLAYRDSLADKLRELRKSKKHFDAVPT